jgi:DNA-binding transcriptional LysR family regulator
MKGSRLYIDIFKVFCDLAETKNFSRTAEKNHITQSAVSQQIAYLERYFGKKMIIRSKGKFALTPEGKIFLGGCKQIIKTYQHTMHQMQTENGEISQSVNIQSIYSIGFYHLPPLIKSFMKKYKKINLHIEYNRSDRIYSDVINGLCDIGIVAYPWQHPLVDIKQGEKEKLTCVCALEYELSKRKKISLKDLNHRDFISFVREIPTRNAIDEILKDHNVKVNIVHEYDNVETLKSSLELGECISILPENTIQQELKNMELVSIPIKEGPFFRNTGIITRKDRQLSHAIHTFIKHFIT